MLDKSLVTNNNKEYIKAKEYQLLNMDIAFVGEGGLKKFFDGREIESQLDEVFTPVDDDGHPQRTGNVWTASCHVITAVIGSGVLSLAWSMAQLGWIAGPLVLSGFSIVTYYTSVLLADCYRSPDPTTGARNYTYMDAVRAILGGRKVFLCGLVQYMNLVGTAIGYTITASISMVAIGRSNCFHEKGRDSSCYISNNLYMAIFGATQVVLSQIPNFSKLWWLSIVAAVMSLSYSFIGLGLGIGMATEKSHSHGTLEGVGIGVVFKSKTDTWNIFQALGNIAFAYSFSMILIEIQDTVKSPPAENKTMRKASTIGVTVTTLFYMSVGCAGYAAFGKHAPGNLLTGFGFYNPFWLVDIANICIVIHLVGAYQVFCQPLYAFVEAWSSNTWTKSCFIQNEYQLDIPVMGQLKLNLFRLVWRTCFVVFTTVVSMILPFFNAIMGVLGAVAFFPLTVYFPVQMHIAQKKINQWTLKWCFLQLLNVLCFAVTMAALVGSLAGVVNILHHYTPFKTNY
ncbi:amino acid permease 3 [Cryptomeria japonica]|uniref:amino acid permease 3 n=1 Tax=Cryptomeria japonica TaxID=3369 RepID=UPI0027DA6019|nr:amino acid permease 3 [Cryptomeria japonica]XP_057863796.2 amino acid permease 3 [Cryptomeria japonica]XP_057863797.2 amino acid permease 3 [Cryptomeria japonica]XP_057863798.2 amino acid permease 3 [Cryptomeria japonica]XP_057863799.2 amino acid permease 3 [Cryptomeria japonica]